MNKHRKKLTREVKDEMIKAAGSVKTKNNIDIHEICREERIQ